MENNSQNSVRDIVISQTRVMAMRQAGANRKQMAEYYGITPQEMYQVMVDFGMYKSKEVEESREYNIIPNFDYENPFEETTNESTTTDDYDNRGAQVSSPSFQEEREAAGMTS